MNTYVVFFVLSEVVSSNNRAERKYMRLAVCGAKLRSRFKVLVEMANNHGTSDKELVVDLP